MKKFRSLMYLGLSSLLLASVGTGVGANASATFKTSHTGYAAQVTNLYHKSGKHKILHVKKNTKMRILKLDVNNKLSKVKVGKHVGYIYNNKMSAVKGMNTNMYNRPSAELTTQSTMYAKPNSHSKKLQTIPENATVKYSSEHNGFTKVKYNQQIGYINKKDLQTLLMSK